MSENILIKKKNNQNTMPKKCWGCTYRRGVDGNRPGQRSVMSICCYMLETGKMRNSYASDHCEKWRGDYE